MWELACQRRARSASHSQELVGGLRNRLAAIAPRKTTLTSNTAHRPIFFQLVSATAAVVAGALGVATTSPCTVALPSVASFSGLKSGISVLSGRFAVFTVGLPSARLYGPSPRARKI